MREIKAYILSLFIFCAISFGTEARTSPQAQISRLDETTHIEFSGLKTWKYDIQKIGANSLSLTLPSLSEDSTKKLSSYKDQFVKSIEVKAADGQVKILISFNHNDVEHFDYMTDDPSLLILDFYQKMEDEKNQGVAEVKAASPKSKPSEPSQKPSLKKDVSRNPANEILVVEKEDPAVSLERRFGAFDSSDGEYGRFHIKDYEIKDSSVIASKQDIFLKFSPLMMPVSRLEYWIGQQPDYIIKPKNTKENKEAQLLQTLHVRGRENVFLRTYQYFKKTYPQSEYREIMDNLVADIYLKRWIKNGKPSDYDMAKDQLSDLIERYSDSALTQRNRFLLAYATMERGEALPALENFQELLNLYPDSTEAPFLKFATAESYLDLKKFDSARSVYEKIMKEYPNSNFSAQAVYRMGDVSMRAEQWQQAAKEYLHAVQSSGKYEKDFANAHFNRGEALFWEGKYRESVEEFAQFIKLFPTHPHGAYAMTRIGELFNIMGANTQRVMGAYLESYFRYPNQDGAKIARIRMLSQKMKTMSNKAFERALEEINSLKKELNLSDVEEFVTIITAKGYEERADYLSSIDLLSGFYQKHPTSQYGEKIQRGIRRGIAKEIRSRVDKKNYLEALRFFQDYSKTWLNGADRLDIDFDIARSYELAGVNSEAKTTYQKVIRKLERIAGTQEEKERAVEESLPSKDQVYLRLAKVNNEQREYVDAYKNLKNIGDPKSLSDGERIERTQLMADLWIQRGDYEDAAAALDILIKDFEGDERSLAPAMVKRAQVQNHLKKWENGAKSADRVLMLKDVPEKLRTEAFAAKVRAQLEMGLKASAISTLQDQLAEFEGKVPMESTRYKLGELLYEEGDLAAAESVWSRLKDSTSSVLWKIAEEKLKAADFNKNYSRYIDRIPAMAAEGEKQ